MSPHVSLGTFTQFRYCSSSEACPTKHYDATELFVNGKAYASDRQFLITMTVITDNKKIAIPARALLLTAAVMLSACQTVVSDHSRQPGAFLNPPKVGAVIPSLSGSVVCLNELDALAMARTGFFTQSCSILTPEMKLVAESLKQVDAGEGIVIMVQTALEGKTAWVPIPWHDWV